MTISKTKLIYIFFAIVFMLSIFTGSDMLIFSYEAELIMVLAIIMLFDSLTKHRLFHLNPDKGLLLLFFCQIVYMVLGYFMYSLYPWKTFTFVIRHIVLIPFLLVYMDQNYLIKLLALCRKYILLIVFVYYIMWFFHGNNGSFLNNYQYVAAYSSILIALLLAKLFTYPIFKRQDIAEIIFCLGALFLTGKRSYVLILIILFAVGMLFLRSSHKGSKVLRLVLIVGIILAFVLMVAPQLLLSITRLIDLENDISLSGRTRLWDLAKYLWSLNPIYGVGYGVFSTYTANNMSFVYSNFGVQSTFAAHNIYLQLLAETGTVGLIIFLMFFLRALLMCISSIKITSDLEERYILIISLFLQLWFLIYGCSGNPLYMPGQFGLYLFSIVAMRSVNGKKHGEE